jgi:hypothetical protein
MADLDIYSSLASGRSPGLSAAKEVPAMMKEGRRASAWHDDPGRHPRLRCQAGRRAPGRDRKALIAVGET